MNKHGRSAFVVFVALLVLGATKAAALGGCVDSPEDPTAVMALLGGVAVAIPLVSSRIRSRNRNR